MKEREKRAEGNFIEESYATGGLLEGFLESHLDKLLVSYKEKTKEELEKIQQGDWIDVRAYGAKKIIANLEINDNFIITPKNESFLPILTREKNNKNIKIETGIYEEEQVKFIRYKKGDFLLVDLGFSLKLPKYKEALIVPRSSLFKNTGLIQTNSMGVIDNSYCGSEDYWMLPLYATKDGFLIIGERIAQFRTIENMPPCRIEKNTSTEPSDSRGGFGTTGEL